jgi:spore coat protein CotF
LNNDFLDPINAENMPYAADSALAMELLMAAKNGVRNLAFAISETASPRLRALLRQQLAEALAMHTEVATLMMQKRWFHPYQLDEQYRLDTSSADLVGKIAEMELFPGDTSRWGTFATPNI